MRTFIRVAYRIRIWKPFRLSLTKMDKNVFGFLPPVLDVKQMVNYIIKSVELYVPFPHVSSPVGSSIPFPPSPVGTTLE
jgi:hypothetical protein